MAVTVTFHDHSYGTIKRQCHMPNISSNVFASVLFVLKKWKIEDVEITIKQQFHLPVFQNKEMHKTKPKRLP